MNGPMFTGKTAISRDMAMAEIRPHLVSRGIRDLTKDIEATSANPLASGGLSDIYEGGLSPNWNLHSFRDQTSYTHQTSPKSTTRQFSSNSARLSHIRFRCIRVAIRMRRSNPDSAGYYWQTASDVYKWSKCQHPNVLKLLGFAIIDDRIGLVLPWVDTGTVMDYVRTIPAWNLKGPLDLCVQITNGVAYLHSVGIVHGDIKGDNVLVSKEGTAMLTDFDEAELGERSLVFTDNIGANGISLRWAAPELIMSAGSSKKTRNSDVYALGMTILEVLTGKPPDFGSENMARIALLIYQGHHPTRPDTFSDDYGDDLWSLLVQSWQYEPQTRPTANYIVNILVKVSPRNRSIPPLSPGGPIDCQPGLPPYLPPGTISREMYLEDVVSSLAARGCPNISEKINNSTFGVMPSLYGGSGDVYCGSLLDSTVVCVKVPRYTQNYTKRAESQVYTSREIHTWNKCKHPNILPFLGLAIFRDRLAMVSPWIKNGTMRNFLKQNPEADRCQLSVQICAGVAYLHDIDVVHGDLKGDNVLISDDGNALLTDFGSADIKNRTIKFTQLMDKCGWTMRWGAPELLQELVPLSKESDVYALGMTILEAITGQIPFADKQEMAVMLAVCFDSATPTRPTVQIPANSKSGDWLWELLCRCWSRDMEKRPSAAEVVDIMRTIKKEGLVPLESRENSESTHPISNSHVSNHEANLSGSSSGAQCCRLV